MQEFWRQMEGLAVQQGEWTSGHCTEHIKMVQTVHLNLCVFMRILPQLKKLYSSTVRLCLLGNLPSPSSHLDLSPRPLCSSHTGLLAPPPRVPPLGPLDWLFFAPGCSLCTSPQDRPLLTCPVLTQLKGHFLQAALLDHHHPQSLLPSTLSWFFFITHITTSNRVPCLYVISIRTRP